MLANKERILKKKKEDINFKTTSTVNNLLEYWFHSSDNQEPPAFYFQIEKS